MADCELADLVFSWLDIALYCAKQPALLARVTDIVIVVYIRHVFLLQFHKRYWFLPSPHAFHDGKTMKNYPPARRSSERERLATV